mgnify:FL=1
MIETALALLCAHVLADFLFQTNWIVENKRKPLVLLLHIAIVAAASWIALGGAWQAALAISAAHLVIDAVKTYALRNTLASFTLDQSAHILSIAAVAFWMPNAFETGLWAPHSAYFIPAAVLLTGAVLTIQTGGYVIGLLMARFDASGMSDGLENAGRLIGQLERSLIFLMVLVGQPAGIGFLIAAKSVLRFDTTQDNKKASEYVIIGTLASFGWAMAFAYASKHALGYMAP